MSVRLEANVIRALGRAISNGAGFDFPSTGGGPPFIGDGSGLTNLNASQLTSGTIPSARMPYKIYRALLTQVGGAAPIATVLENTLGGTVIWARSSQGVYTAALTGAFPNGKTHILTGSDWVTTTNFTILMSTRTSADVVTLQTQNIDISGPTSDPNDGLLSSTSIQILVYP